MDDDAICGLKSGHHGYVVQGPHRVIVDSVGTETGADRAALTAAVIRGDAVQFIAHTEHVPQA